MKILIPTCRPKGELREMLEAIASTTTDCHVIVSGLQASASVNRNWCLDHINVGDIAIMLDDDIEAFYQGWVEDLISPLWDTRVVMVSARLLNPDGSFGQTCSRCYKKEPDEIEVFSNGEAILPTAAIAFRFTGHRYDCQFLGSGYEDSDYCMQLLRDIPDAKFIQSNKCRLVHRNEQKKQGENWKHNRKHFLTKWRRSLVKA